MNDTTIGAVLAGLPHFANLPGDLRSRLAEGSRRLKLQNGEILFSQGEEARGFFAVESGAVRVFRMTPDGREQVLHHLHSGQTFAEAAVLSMGRYPAHAKAVEDDTSVIEIGATVFGRLFREDPRLAAAMVSSLCIWLHAMAERVEELSIMSAPARFARFLLRQPAKDDGAALVVELPLAKKDLAAHLAIAPETLSRLLRRWQDAGVIESRGKQVAILDTRVLIAVADREGES